jgi:hypothetical protein
MSDDLNAASPSGDIVIPPSGNYQLWVELDDEPGEQFLQSSMMGRSGILRAVDSVRRRYWGIGSMVTKIWVEFPPMPGRECGEFHELTPALSEKLKPLP